MVFTITEIFEKLGYDIDLTALMENDTVENLAAYIESKKMNETD